ncbi:hypothetical protein QUB63_19610 [Microcoleus sp. ARI1-B5]|uniref:hypothetical protein n=1 Tax=unclassified Microcoleus TaxID=2642155 RepID=UPI002FD01C2E
MSSHDRKLLKEFYRYFPDVVMEFCDASAIDRRHSHSQRCPDFGPGDRFVGSP